MKTLYEVLVKKNLKPEPCKYYDEYIQWDPDSKHNVDSLIPLFNNIHDYITYIYGKCNEENYGNLYHDYFRCYLETIYKHGDDWYDKEYEKRMDDFDTWVKWDKPSIMELDKELPNLFIHWMQYVIKIDKQHKII